MINFFKQLITPIHQQSTKNGRSSEINSSASGIPVNTIRWDVQNKSIEFSPKTLEMLEYPANYIFAYDKVSQLAYPEDMEHIRSVMTSIFVNKFFPDFYCRVITQKNNIKHIYVKGEVQLDNDGTIILIKAELRDVTEQGVYIQKIQQQNQRLQDIAWIQSHKMRSPVATIMGLIQLFNCDNPNDPVNIKVLEGVKEAARHLDEAIKEINAKTETMKFVS